MIIQFLTRFNLLEDRVRFIAVAHHANKEEDYASGREVDCEKVWQAHSKEANSEYNQT